MNLAKQYIWDNETIMSYVDENNEEQIVDIPKGLLNLKGFEIIMSTGTKEERGLNEMKQFALQSFSKGALPWENFTQIYSTDSMREALKKSEYFSQEAQRLAAESRQADTKNEEALQEQKIKLQGEMTQMVEGQKRQIEKLSQDLAAQRLEFDKLVASENIKLKTRELDIKESTAQLKANSEFSGVQVQSQVKQEHNRAEEQIKILKTKLESLAKQVQSNKPSQN
jgi:hypothetical protein